MNTIQNFQNTRRVLAAQTVLELSDEPEESVLLAWPVEVDHHVSLGAMHQATG